MNPFNFLWENWLSHLSTPATGTTGTRAPSWHIAIKYFLNQYWNFSMSSSSSSSLSPPSAMLYALQCALLCQLGTEHVPQRIQRILDSSSTRCRYANVIIYVISYSLRHVTAYTRGHTHTHGTSFHTNHATIITSIFIFIVRYRRSCEM